MKHLLRRPQLYALYPYFFLAILFCAPLPFLSTLLYFSVQHNKLSALAHQIRFQHTKAELFWELQKKEASFIKDIKASDPAYLEKNLSSLCFLESEIQKLETLSSHWEQNRETKRRLIFLKEGSNRLRFSQESLVRADGWQEVEERQQSPIECSEEDLKKILSLIEGVTIWPYGPKEGRPQLILKDFELVKKPLSSQEAVFALNIHLLKREKITPYE